MGVSLRKGENVSLTKEAGGQLNAVMVGLGWDARSTDGVDFDLDASAFGLGSDDKVLSDAWFVYYGNLRSPDGNIVHQGDNLTGAGDGDDEEVVIQLAALSAEISKIVIPVTIYEANERKQNFGQVSNAFVRIVDQSTGTELARFDLGEDFSLETAVKFGELYRHNGEWKFRAVGQGYNDGLAGLCREYGVNVG